MDKLEVILHLYAEWAEQIINAEVELDWCTDFGSYPEDFDSFRIEVGMLIREDDVSDLPSFYQHNFSCEWQFNEVEIYVLCFLHEVGHLQTWWLLYLSRPLCK